MPGAVAPFHPTSARPLIGVAGRLSTFPPSENQEWLI